MRSPRRRSRTPRRARDRQILDHVDRYHLTTYEALGRLFFSQQTPSAAVKVTTRLVRQLRLARFTLCHPVVYFTLGEQEAKDRGLPAHRTQSMGPQALPVQFAALAYATLGPKLHPRLTMQELQQLHPWLSAEWLEPPHCLDTEPGQSVLELLRVDLRGTPDHIARKCASDIRVRRQARQFDGLMRQGRFRLVIVTGTPEKAAAIKTSLSGHVWPDGLQLHLAVVPQLLLLTASTHDDP